MAVHFGFDWWFRLYNSVFPLAIGLATSFAQKKEQLKKNYTNLI